MDNDVLILPIEICRICTNLQPNLDIITNKLEGENVLLHEALEFVSCIKIDFNDGMSRTMCLTCCKRLLDAYKFKNQILDSYRTYYKQTSDVRFKKDDSNPNHEDVASKSDIDVNNTTDSKLKDDPSLVIERANELGIKLSTDAVSFILEQNSCKNRNKRKQSLASENIETDKQIVTDTEEDNVVYIVSTPSIEFETLDRQTNVESSSIDDEDMKISLIDIEESQSDYIEHPAIEHEDTKAQPTPNSRPPGKHIKSSNTNKKTGKTKLTCHICYKTLPKKSNLIDHIRLHNNEKNFVCPFCEKAFVQIANYRTHLRIHTKERPYKCHLCPKTYNQAGALNTHIRSHTNERNYVCDVCYKDFTSSSDLGKHKRIHDRSRQFECETCGNLFTQKVNLKVHERNVHFINRN